MILLTGGTGRLGTELQKLRTFYAPSSLELDITDISSIKKLKKKDQIKLIVHCAAYTDVEGAQIDRENCYKTNVIGTKNLTILNKPILYISTEYVFDGEKGNYTENDFPNPQNYYALTKYLGELSVENGKIVRLLFKPRPFPYPKAFTDQWTSGDYVDIIAKEVDKAIRLFDVLPKIIHIGTGRKSIYQLAKQSRDVGKTSINTIKTKLPKDTSLDTQLWEEIKHDSSSSTDSRRTNKKRIT